MPVIEIVSNEERKLWYARKAELNEHSSYKTKQQYFPKNMDEWEEKGKEIERVYRQELLALNKQRKELERKVAEIYEENARLRAGIVPAVEKIIDKELPVLSASMKRA